MHLGGVEGAEGLAPSADANTACRHMRHPACMPDALGCTKLSQGGQADMAPRRATGCGRGPALGHLALPASLIHTQEGSRFYLSTLSSARPHRGVERFAVGVLGRRHGELIEREGQQQARQGGEAACGGLMEGMGGMF